MPVERMVLRGYPDSRLDRHPTLGWVMRVLENEEFIKVEGVDVPGPAENIVPRALLLDLRHVLRGETPQRYTPLAMQQALTNVIEGESVDSKSLDDHPTVPAQKLEVSGDGPQGAETWAINPVSAKYLTKISPDPDTGQPVKREVQTDDTTANLVLKDGTTLILRRVLAVPIIGPPEPYIGDEEWCARLAVLYACEDHATRSEAKVHLEEYAHRCGAKWDGDESSFQRKDGSC